MVEADDAALADVWFALRRLSNINLASLLDDTITFPYYSGNFRIIIYQHAVITYTTPDK